MHMISNNKWYYKIINKTNHSQLFSLCQNLQQLIIIRKIVSKINKIK
jgi:hypothetical protein